MTTQIATISDDVLQEQDARIRYRLDGLSAAALAAEAQLSEATAAEDSIDDSVEEDEAIRRLARLRIARGAARKTRAEADAFAAETSDIRSRAQRERAVILLAATTEKLTAGRLTAARTRLREDIAGMIEAVRADVVALETELVEYGGLCRDAETLADQAGTPRRFGCPTIDTVLFEICQELMADHAQDGSSGLAVRIGDAGHNVATLRIESTSFLRSSK